MSFHVHDIVILCLYFGGIAIYIRGVNYMTAASDRATASLQALATEVSAAVAKLSAPAPVADTSVSDAVFTSLADGMDAQSKALATVVAAPTVP